MADSDQESTSNTEDLISGVFRIDDISPLASPSPRTPKSKPTGSVQRIMNEDKDSGQGSSMATPVGTCFDVSNPNTVKAKVESPRSRSLSPQSRIRVHYTDSAREALDLANKSYERLVEESDERHHLTILLNKQDSERGELESRERAQLKKLAENKENLLKPIYGGRTATTTASPKSADDKLSKPIAVIQDHIRFAESILASPPSSESGRRSRSLSPLPPNRALSPSQRADLLADRSRSSSPITRPGNDYRGSTVTSSRKKLNFEEKRSNSPLLSRSGREKTAQEIKTRVTNDYIDATSHSFKRYSPDSVRMSTDRMAAMTVSHVHADHSHSSSSVTRLVPSMGGESKAPVYATPEKGKHFSPSHAPGPVSSTPHRHRHREPMRELSPNRNTVEGTPSTYIKGLQSVRSGLRKLISDETDTAEEMMVHASSRADNVSLRIESTINAENQLLRDQLTRERNLRKQIEADKQELQCQLLESKDRLHHLTSTLKQKEGMMKKLDQNLDDVVNGWQKHEQENKKRNESLSHSIRRLERELEEQKTHSSGLESDLSNAVEDLRREKETNHNLMREASEQHVRYQEEITDLKNLLEREQDKTLRLELESSQANEGRVHVEKQLAGLQDTLDQERDNFKEREQELLNKINEITSVQIEVLEQEAARTKAQAEKIEELGLKAKKFEQEAESQRHLASSKIKELERLQSLLELTDAKHQNSLRQLESKLRVELELRVSQAKDDGLKRLADNEILLQQAHQRQLADVVSEHNRQLGAMRERFNNEINRVKNQLEDQVKSSESSLEETKQELESVVLQKELAESQRDDLTSRLQAVLALLGAAVPNPGTVLPHSTSSSNSIVPPQSLSHQPNNDDVTPHHIHQTLNMNKPLTVDVTPERPPTPQLGSNSSHQYEHKGADTSIVPYSDTSANTGDEKSASHPSHHSPEENSGHGLSGDEQRQLGDYRQQYEKYRESYKRESELEEKEEEGESLMSNTETYDLNENDAHYRHRRQAELQDYIKKLLNRSVGDPLIETRIDLDESHISVISGLQEHSVILHDGSHEHHSSPKKAFRHDILDHTPPVKGSAKKAVNPKEIASLITKYGSGSESTTPSTTEYIEYLKSVAVNNHTGFLKDLLATQD